MIVHKKCAFHSAYKSNQIKIKIIIVRTKYTEILF